MEQELQDKIFEKYPKIFRQKDLPMQQTCMCWGITCGDGWYNIIETACMVIQNHVNYKNASSEEDMIFEAAQIKEKFGGLRFYYDGGDDTVAGIIQMAEAMKHAVISGRKASFMHFDHIRFAILCFFFIATFLTIF